jgi:hypothetical protein
MQTTAKQAEVASQFENALCLSCGHSVYHALENCAYTIANILAKTLQILGLYCTC